jgi:hypothetical protein
MPVNNPFQLIKGKYYYVDEQGLYVFTEHFHRKRGYCCKSGCRHCPWGHGKANRSKTRQ